MTREGNMAQLKKNAVSVFNYHSIDCKLLKKTKTLFITFLDNNLCYESVFELEGLLNWLSDKIEISTVVFDQKIHDDKGNSGNDKLQLLNNQQMNTLYEKTLKLTIALLYLPQTFIFDYGETCSGLLTSLSLGADIRISRRGANIRFLPVKEGFFPTPGVFLLERLIGRSMGQIMLQQSKNLSDDRLQYCGLLFDTYSGDRPILEELIENFFNQSQIARIQLKQAMLNPIVSQIPALMEQELKAIRAFNYVEDWKRGEGHFLSARDLFPAEAGLASNV